MLTLENLRKQFVNPSVEFGPIPFWFWNDELSKEEIIRQIQDFHTMEVGGFVIHPRMGLPRSIPYMSELFMAYVEVAVAEAARLGMRVILYDEAMYPSGSAGGMVVRHNPEYASRGLQLREYPYKQGQDYANLLGSLKPGEVIVSVQAVCKSSDAEIILEKTIVLDRALTNMDVLPHDEGNWSVLLFVDTYSKGTIRGVHDGQDDGELDAPAASDLLNPEAVQAFISFTHERYYERLQPYFGNTIFAMFTDEPDLLGRNHVHGLKPWTSNFLGEYTASGNLERDLPTLWFEAGSETRVIRDRYETAIRNRLSRVYYKSLADWCEAHGIGLTGHPALSDEIGLLEHFHIPGQDVVWRYIAPEDNTAITGAHSTMGKCSSDSARHRSRRRNLNECFGACGKESGWALSADHLKWYLDWLFVRGVNLISPHAFYYSIRNERRDERPPDVGPNNIWWSNFHELSRYIKRMSWLMTDSVNGAEVAVLAQAAYLPWKVVKPLYERQIEFNYLEEQLLLHASQVIDGTIRIADQKYKAIVVEDGGRFGAECTSMLQQFIRQGGIVMELTGNGKGLKEIGQQRVAHVEDVTGLLIAALDNDLRLEPAAVSIRISRVIKEGTDFVVIVNEGEDHYEGNLHISLPGAPEIWHPWTGEFEAAHYERLGDEQAIKVNIARRECIVIAIDRMGETAPIASKFVGTKETIDLSEGWRILHASNNKEIRSLSSWTEWKGMKHYSGTISYEQIFELSEHARQGIVELDLGDAHEFVRLWVNGQKVGVRMWKPYVFKLNRELLQNNNELRVAVTNSLANSYDDLTLPSGLLGPVTLTIAHSVDKFPDF